MQFWPLILSVFAIATLSGYAFAASTDEKLSYDDPILRAALLQQADSMIQRNPRDSRPYAVRAAIFLWIGQLNNALLDLSNLIQLNPSDHYWYDIRANAEAIKGDLAAALTDESTAILLSPNLAYLYSNRASILLLANRLNEASVDGSKAISLNSRLAPAYENLAEIQFKMKNYKITIEYCNSAILRAPNFPDAYYYRGLAYEKLGNKEQAAADKDKARSLGFKGSGTIYKAQYNQ
jgi:tetratricopeptide (TPR) repeat protein